MVRDTGFEPVTPTVSRWCSTTELTAHVIAKACYSAKSSPDLQEGIRRNLGPLETGRDKHFKPQKITKTAKNSEGFFNEEERF
jgi:hypothetical protein